MMFRLFPILRRVAPSPQPLSHEGRGTSLGGSVTALLCALGIAAALLAPLSAQAHRSYHHGHGGGSEASLALSLMPVASVAVASGAASTAASAAAGAVVALPVALAVSGAVLVVKVVEVSAIGTLYVLERASDGAQASIHIMGQTAASVAHGVGTLVSCSVIGAGVILSVAGEVLAFIPNELGNALLYNERL